MRGTVKVEQLGDEVGEERWRWFGRVLTGKREAGRPQKRFVDVGGHGGTVVDVKAEDKVRWRQVIGHGDP